MPHRSIDQLVDTTDPGMAVVKEWISSASNKVELLAVDPAAGRRALLALQVTSRSPMGALALESGGMLIDDGWVRVLGGGHERLPRTLDTWNRLGDPPHRLPGAILVGDDVLGAFFALNGGGIPGPPGHVFYYAPDSLEWEEVAASYSDWIQGLLQGDLEQFYGDQRWNDWRDEVRQLPGDRAFSIYPPLFAEGPPIGERARRPVPLLELWGLHVGEVPKQLGR